MSTQPSTVEVSAEALSMALYRASWDAGAAFACGEPSGNHYDKIDLAKEAIRRALEVSSQSAGLVAPDRALWERLVGYAAQYGGDGRTAIPPVEDVRVDVAAARAILAAPQDVPLVVPPSKNEGATQAGTSPETPALRHCADCDRPELCDLILPGTGPCGKNAGCTPEQAVLGTAIRALDAWREYAGHQEWCRYCGEDGVKQCDKGRPLQEEAESAHSAFVAAENRLRARAVHSEQARQEILMPQLLPCGCHPALHAPDVLCRFAAPQPGTAPRDER